MSTPAGRLVWDLPVRACHWLLVAGVSGCWITQQLGPSWFDWHVRIGCAVLVLAAFRVLWGLFGTRHARFASFVRGPKTVWAYVRAQIPGGPAVTSGVGHNPLGALGVLSLLGLLLLQAVTGLFGNDDIDNTGPLFGWVSDSTSHLLTTVHRWTFSVLEVFIAVHVLAVLWHQMRGHDLIRPMWTGRKPAADVPAPEAIPGSKLLRASVLLAAVVAILSWILWAAPPASLY